jgi:hypothetical protein
MSSSLQTAADSALPVAAAAHAITIDARPRTAAAAASAPSAGRLEDRGKTDASRTTSRRTELGLEAHMPMCRDVVVDGLAGRDHRWLLPVARQQRR